MKKEFQFAFRRTIPVLFGYLFLGAGFGLLLQKSGYGFLWAAFMALTIYGGSMQYAMVSMITGGVSLLTTAFMTLSINSRHIFYGLSFLEKFKGMGKAYPYMIFSLTDETYSLLCSTAVPDDLDENKTFFLIALLDHGYWIMGCTLGALVGQLIPFNSEGVEFAMTALFVVIFVEQWLGTKNHFPALLGLGCGALSLIIFSPENFIMPALIAAVVSLLISIRFTNKKEVSK